MCEIKAFKQHHYSDFSNKELCFGWLLGGGEWVRGKSRRVLEEQFLGEEFTVVLPFYGLSTVLGNFQLRAEGLFCSEDPLMETASPHPLPVSHPRRAVFSGSGHFSSVHWAHFHQGGKVAISALCEAFCTIWAGWISTKIVKKHLSRKIKVSLAKCGLERFASSVHCGWETGLYFEKLQERQASGS